MDQAAAHTNPTPRLEKLPRTRLLLSQLQMLQNEYTTRAEGNRVSTSPGGHSPATDASPMFAIDCEMCRTGPTAASGELTSIVVVDEDLNCVYQKLVKPLKPIMDYRTPWSGITESMLQNVKTTLTDVQRDIQGLLPADAILVGHSLSVDLRAMKMFHPHIIDTALIPTYMNTRGRSRKLKDLAAIYLGKNLQSTTQKALDDAVATMQLAKLELRSSKYS